MNKEFYQCALDYHRLPTPGKLAIVATKPLATQRDLALAYSPGVAAACEEIVKDPLMVSSLTARANLVAVISNGTAVLGLGNIGPLASKPVMEGKAVLFKKFAGIDVFDIEINETDPAKLVDIIASLEPTFGAVNLEDIKAPECFEVEARLLERMKIPVFHDDQHGTAIIVSAAILNALKLTGKNISEVKLVSSGAGAAAIACFDLLVSLGMSSENITVCDQKGVIYQGRPNLEEPSKLRYACKTECRTIEEALGDADIFLGLSTGNVIQPEALKTMAPSPIVLALANPISEVDPEGAKRVRPDAIIATGRSDYPNQVNNVLCFPFIFRGALDVGATEINREMKMACVHALAALAQAEASDIVANAYGGQELRFGPEYIIPKPFDPRLILELAPAVAKAAMDTGVATRPIDDFEAYYQKLSESVFRSGFVMRPLFMQAKTNPKRIVYAEGEDERVLRALQVIVDEKIAHPILIGRHEVVATRMKRLGLRLEIDKDYSLVDPEHDPRYKDYCALYHELMQREGVSPDYAKVVVRTNTSVIAALMVHRGEADAMLAGPIGRFEEHFENILPILEVQEGQQMVASLNVLVTQKGPFFFCDPYVNIDPSAEEIAEMTLLAADRVRHFGLEPKVALLSHSNFGSFSTLSSQKMKDALEILRDIDPTLEVEGEMHADAAIDPTIREQVFPNSRLIGAANLLIMPNIDAANIAFNTAKVIGDGQSIGPILLGLQRPAHILTPSATVRGIVNMTTLAVVDGQKNDQSQTHPTTFKA
jgi:malate dehydrogenase (oxaloacetate-decarboxylating)(NADP+)